ncbi:MAG: hypothetical protein IPF94_00625 [Betaproteobacteria bacterium]|nr:hypothetical protein [Betaproteobacteria bacterium]
MRWAAPRVVAPAALIAVAAAGFAAFALVAHAAPEVQLSVGAPLGDLPRIGVNLGSRTVWGGEQLMANVLRNPGLEGTWDGALVVVARIDGAVVEDDSRWTARPAGFWAGATFEVLSGPAAGQRGRVLDNRRASAQTPDRLTLAPLPAALRPGDVLSVQGLQDHTPAPLWWTQGQVQAAAEPRPGSPGQRAVRLAASSGSPAALFHHLDSIGERAGKLLPVQGRWRLALWLRSETAGAHVRLSFGRQGRPPWLDRTLAPGAGWQAVEIVFDARDDGPPGPLMLAIRAEDGSISVDDVELGVAAEPQAGGFRAEVVDTLRALRPGYLRDWQGQLADTPANRLAAPLARRPVRYRPGVNEVQFTYSLPEFLALAAEVGARPWVVLPSTSTPEQAREFGRALAQGWQRHRFAEIVVEHGNEHWNSIFRPAGIADAKVLAQVADAAFAALREGTGAAVPLHRVIGTQFVDGAAAGRTAALSRQSEGVAVAPYFHFRQDRGEAADAALDRALHEEVRPLQRAIAGTTAQGRSLDVYEVNFHTTAGNASAAERDAVLTTPAAGAALMRRLLQAANAGVRRQAVYTLAGYDTFVTGESRQLVQLFGITRDLATAAHWRSTGEALAALNQVVGGTANAASCSGSACTEITAIAIAGGERWAVVSSAAQALHVSWPCKTAQQLRSSTGSRVVTVCEAGRIALLLPPRSWVTSGPQ